MGVIQFYCPACQESVRRPVAVYQPYFCRKAKRRVEAEEIALAIPIEKKNIPLGVWRIGNVRPRPFERVDMEQKPETLALEIPDDESEATEETPNPIPPRRTRKKKDK